MVIKPSSILRRNYAEISELAKSTGEPIYITVNGEGDLVIMDIEAFGRLQSNFKEQEARLTALEKALGSNPATKTVK